MQLLRSGDSNINIAQFRLRRTIREQFWMVSGHVYLFINDDTRDEDEDFRRFQPLNVQSPAFMGHRTSCCVVHALPPWFATERELCCTTIIFEVRALSPVEMYNILDHGTGLYFLYAKNIFLIFGAPSLGS